MSRCMCIASLPYAWGAGYEHVYPSEVIGNDDYTPTTVIISSIKACG